MGCDATRRMNAPSAAQREAMNSGPMANSLVATFFSGSAGTMMPDGFRVQGAGVNKGICRVGFMWGLCGVCVGCRVQGGV